MTQCHTNHLADSAEPTAPLDDINMLLTTSELVIVCLVLTMLTSAWLGVLAFATGYAWERWVGEFFMRATGWLVLP